MLDRSSFEVKHTLQMSEKVAGDSDVPEKTVWNSNFWGFQDFYENQNKSQQFFSLNFKGSRRGIFVFEVLQTTDDSSKGSRSVQFTLP